MKIGILKADSVLSEFQPDYGDYPGMIQQVLSMAPGGTGLELCTFDVEQGRYPQHLDDCDAYIITGSKKSVYDDEPWIHALRDFVIELDRNRVPTVGICFGHQMMALALGGDTRPAAVGWRVGVHSARILATAAFMAPPLDSFKLLYSHKDQVTRLPPGARLLASSDSCPNAMFQIGEHMLALQGHPEFINGYSLSLLNLRRHLLGEAVYHAGVASLAQSTDEVLIAGWLLRFLGAGLAAD